MESDAHRHAVEATRRAERALERLSAAENHEDAEEAWDHFLAAISRTHEKLRAGAKGHPESWAWFKKVMDERRDDELLAYVHHARNSDHHRFEDVAKWVPGGIGIGARGSVYIDRLVFNGDKITESKWTPMSPGAQLLVTQYAATLSPVSVIDKGVTYEIPTQHLGQPLTDKSVLNIARLALDYARGMVVVSESLLR